MKSHVRGLALTLAAAISAVLVWQPTPSVTQAAPALQGGVVNVYSARHYDTDDALFNGFTQQSGVAVKRTTSPSMALSSDRRTMPSNRSRSASLNPSNFGLSPHAKSVLMSR